MAEKDRDEPKVPPKLQPQVQTKIEREREEEPNPATEPIKSMIGATVLVKNPNGQWNPAIVLEDNGGNFKLCVFWDSGQRMGVCDTLVIQDSQPMPKDIDEEEANRPWAYWRAI